MKFIAQNFIKGTASPKISSQKMRFYFASPAARNFKTSRMQSKILKFAPFLDVRPALFKFRRLALKFRGRF